MPTLTVDPLEAPQAGPVVSTFAGGAATTGEWFGMHPSGATATPSNYVGWQWSCGGQGSSAGTASGELTWPFNNPSLPAGTYRIVWWPASGTTPIAQSDVFTLGTPPPPSGDWTPMQPSVQEYVDLWRGGAGLRASLELYEPGSRRTPWIKNTTNAPVEVRVCLNGPSDGPHNAVLYWRKNDTDRPDLAGGPPVHGGARPDHVNAAQPNNPYNPSEGNDSMTLTVWPGQSYRLCVFGNTMPETLFETALEPLA